MCCNKVSLSNSPALLKLHRQPFLHLQCSLLRVHSHYVLYLLRVHQWRDYNPDRILYVLRGDVRLLPLDSPIHWHFHEPCLGHRLYDKKIKIYALPQRPNPNICLIRSGLRWHFDLLGGFWIPSRPHPRQHRP